MEKIVKISDLAELANCSASQVSRALSGRGRVAESTRQRVVELARQYNFRNLKFRSPRAAVIRGSSYFVHSFFNTLDTYLALQKISPLILHKYNETFLRQYTVESVLLLDMPPEERAYWQKNLHCPVHTASLFAADTADLAMPWDDIINAAGEYLRKLKCRRPLLMVPRLPGCQAIALPENCFIRDRVTLPCPELFKHPAPEYMRQFDAFLPLLPANPEVIWQFIRQCCGNNIIPVLNSTREAFPLYVSAEPAVKKVDCGGCEPFASFCRTLSGILQKDAQEIKTASR
jgi:hypothetical protein